MVWDTAAAADLTNPPHLYERQMVTMDRNGRIMTPWHGSENVQPAGPACFGFYGILEYYMAGPSAPYFKTTDANGFALVPPYWDYTGAVESGWALRAEGSVNARDAEAGFDIPGMMLVTETDVALEVLGSPGQGKDVYLVDSERVTTVVGDVVNAIKVGRITSLHGTDKQDPTGNTKLWRIHITSTHMPAVPA
jgi:hypothetical protein